MQLSIRQTIKFALAVGESLPNQSKDAIWFVQNGRMAGQSVPHTHLHVLQRPEDLYVLKFGRNFVGSPKTLSAEEMKVINNSYRPRTLIKTWSDALKPQKIC